MISHHLLPTCKGLTGDPLPRAEFTSTRSVSTVGSEVLMFGRKAEKSAESGATSAQIEKAMGASLRDLADLSKQKIAENIVGTIRGKRIKSEISDADMRTIINIAEMSIDQALTSVGSRVTRAAKDAAE